MKLAVERYLTGILVVGEQLPITKDLHFQVTLAMAHLEQQMGAKTWEKYIKRFKFLQSTLFWLPGEQSGNIAFNITIEQADTAFGQGIQVTAIQMMQGYLQSRIMVKC